MPFCTNRLLTLLVVAAAAVMVSACGGGDETPVPEEARVTVEEVVNQVETDRPRGSDAGPGVFQDAQVGQNLLPGDGVKTFQDGEARVDIVIRASARIARTTPNTVWRLGQFAVDQDTIIELDQGKIFTFDAGVQEGHRPLQIKTPAGTASVRGTWMSVGYDPEIGEAEVQCFRGVCELANDLGTVVLTDQQKSSVTVQTAPAEPELMDEEDLLEFSQLPEAQSGEVAIPSPLVPPATTVATQSPTATPVGAPAATSQVVQPAATVPPVTPPATTPPTIPATTSQFTVVDATIVWIGGSGFWGEIANWSTGVLPAPADRVFIGSDLGNITVTHRTGTSIVTSLVNQQNLVLSGGTLSVSQNLQSKNMTLAGGTLGGAGDLTIDAGGVFTWSGGTMDGGGKVTIPKTGQLNISGGSNKSLRDRTINNSGTTTWSGTGNINSGLGAVFNNLAGGIFDVKNDRSFSNNLGGAAPLFNNTGSVQKTAGAGTATMNVSLQNDGMVDVDTGTLSITRGGASTGTFEVASAATLKFTANYTANQGTYIIGAGSTQLTAGTFSIGATAVGADALTALNLQLGGGTLGGAGDLTIDAGGVFTWSGGTMDGGGKLTIPKTG